MDGFNRWYSELQSGTVWYGMVQYGMVRYVAEMTGVHMWGRNTGVRRNLNTQTGGAQEWWDTYTPDPNWTMDDATQIENTRSFRLTLASGFERRGLALNFKANP